MRNYFYLMETTVLCVTVIPSCMPLLQPHSQYRSQGTKFKGVRSKSFERRRRRRFSPGLAGSTEQKKYSFPSPSKSQQHQERKKGEKKKNRKEKEEEEEGGLSLRKYAGSKHSLAPLLCAVIEEGERLQCRGK